MAAERTIAIVGEKSRFSAAIAEKLAKQNLHLLFISNDEDNNEQLQEMFKKINPPARIEFIHCEKEGCWEADVIAFTNPEKVELELIQRIKEVATQKIVLIVSEKTRSGSYKTNLNFEKLLPHSHIIHVIIDREENEVQVLGKEEEAILIVNEFFEKAGYVVHQEHYFS